MIVVLTGGIGAGKTTAAHLFQQQGITIIDADLIARELVTPQSDYLHQIVQKIGRAILNADGSLNRPLLRKKIFADPGLRAWLEHLLHPPIYQQLSIMAQQSSSPYTILVIPLYYETKQLASFQPDRILTIEADSEQQIKRIQNRDHLSFEEAKAIIALQASSQERERIATEVIHNTTNISCLKKQIDNLHQHYLKLSQNKY